MRLAHINHLKKVIDVGFLPEERFTSAQGSLYEMAPRKISLSKNYAGGRYF